MTSIVTTEQISDNRLPVTQALVPADLVADQICAVDATDFDYAVISDAAAEMATRTAEKFHRWKRRLVSDAIDIGADLLQVKESFKGSRGKFGIWLKSEFGEVRTAQRLMGVAKRFAGKNDKVSFLPLTTIYSLAEPAGETVATDVIARLDRGEELNVEILKAQLQAAQHKRREENHQQRRAENRARVRKRKNEQPDRELQAQKQREQAELKARALVTEFGAATLRELLEALDDVYVNVALRGLIYEQRL